MKKLVMVVLAGLVSGVVAAGPADDAYQAALKLKSDKDFAAASAALQKVATDHPALAGRAKWAAADCLFGQGLNAEAAEAFAVVAKDYAKEKSVACNALHYQGMSYARQRKYEEALVPLDKALADYPEEAAAVNVGIERARVLQSLRRYDEAITAAKQILAASVAFNTTRALTQELVGACYEAAGKKSDAQAAYMAALTENIHYGSLAATSHGVRIFDLVNPSVVGAASYKAFVTELILLTPATEDNAKFLGRLKSELEKIKE